MNLQVPRKRIARIRCLQECIQCYKEMRKFPECVCYVPGEIKYQCTSKCYIQVYAEPSVKSKRIRDLTGSSESTLVTSGEEMCNAEGIWLKIVKIKESITEEEIHFHSDAWVIVSSCTTPANELLPLVEVPNTAVYGTNDHVIINRWQDVVVNHFSLDLRKKIIKVVPPDMQAVAKLQNLPKNWTVEHDEALVQLMFKYLSTENEQFESIKNYVDAIYVSSSHGKSDSSCLTDGDPDTFWESSGRHGQHWIQFKMKKGTIIKKLQIYVDMSVDTYLPSMIVVHGGEIDDQKTLNTLNIDWDSTSSNALTVLEDMVEHYPIITIKIKDCKGGGVNTRVLDVKIVSREDHALTFNRDFFKKENLFRYPILETYTADELYRRSQLLQRFLEIVDNVLQYVVPAWEYSIGSYSSLEYVRQLLPLSRKRLLLIVTFLKESSTGNPGMMPKLYINRRSAMEHRCDPSLDPDYKNSIFMQIYEGLRPKDRSSKPLNYRWSLLYNQWWECKLLSEGAIDRGGGFRDSLCDLAEELCPSSDGPVPIPFFIRSPNQLSEDSNINRDVYVPNPACKEFAKYEWIGQIMGACLRGKVNLVISLPCFVWKKLVGEGVIWSKDYVTVDSALVKFIAVLESMESTEFTKMGQNWSCTLTDGSVVYIRVDGEGNCPLLQYDDRETYCESVKKLRMSEFDEQISAIKTGLLKVIPQAVLDLLMWQELEQRICGDPDISLEALRKSTHYDYVEEKDTRVKYMWEALKNFSNEDRSKFLRFITGCRRLPASVYISTGRGDAEDCLPESSTCSNMLYLPNYTSAKVAEEKLRYATYNCMDIDTDLNNVENNEDEPIF